VAITSEVIAGQAETDEFRFVTGAGEYGN